MRLMVGIFCPKSKILASFTVALLTTFLAVPVTRAELELTGTYLGFDYYNGIYKTLPDDSSVDSIEKSWGFLNTRLGHSLNEYLSIEGHLGFSSNTNTDVGNFVYGVYGKVEQSFDEDKVKLYGLAGFTRLTSYDQDVDTTSINSPGLGLGLEIFGSRDVAIFFEYMRSLHTGVDGGDVTMDKFGLGVNYYFADEKSRFVKNRKKIRSIRF